MTEPSRQGDMKQGNADDKICPFLGTLSIPKMVQPTVIDVGKGAQPEIGVEARFWPCQVERCSFWNADEKTIPGVGSCSVKIGLDAMTRIEPKLAGLSGMLGGGGG